MYRLYISTGVSLNICNSSFKHVHSKQAPIHAICSLQIMKEKTNLQTLLVKWLCTKNTIPQCMQQPFATIVAFFERCVALLSNFRENPPIYVLNHFRNHSIPVGKCSMLFCKIQSVLELLPHGFEKSAILLTHSLKHVFYLWKCRFLSVKTVKCATLL